MPYVNIKLAGNSATPEQKKELIAGATQLITDVLGKRSSATYVVIDEVNTDNWGVGGDTITEIRAKAASEQKG
jgi:4-oxalocrotonate tautomerase